MFRTRTSLVLIIVAALNAAAWAAPISPAARSVIPAAFEQIISMDYRTFKGSQTALALKSQVLPGDLRTFEKALEYIGIAPEKDLDSLTFASFRNAKRELKVLGVASGSFSSAAILEKIRTKAAKPVKYREFDIYPMFRGPDPKSKQLWMSFLDDNTVLFGEDEGLGVALGARSAETPNLGSSQSYIKLMQNVETATVWSVLNHRGTQEMLLSVIEDGGTLARYPELRSSVLNSYYEMTFDTGLNCELNVIMNESSSAQDLSDTLKIGILVKSVVKNPAAKLAFKNIGVSSDHSVLQIHFQLDQQNVQTLLQARFFAAVSATVNGRADRRQ